MGLLRRFWNTLLRGRRDRETRAELDDYLAREAAAGSPRQAAIRLGNAERWREEARAARGLPRLEAAAREFRLAGRGLRRAPGLAAAAVLMLAFGIGATSAAFTLVERVLLQPLPYPAADRLVQVHLTAPGVGLADLGIGLADFLVFQRAQRSFQALGLYATDAVAVTGRGNAEKLPGMDVTAGTLAALAVPPRLGRGLVEADSAPGAPPVVVLGYGYWRRRFAGSPAALGARLTLDGTPRRVVGVMPAGFSILDHADTAFYLPITLDPGKTFLGGFNWDCLARLRPGVSLAAANADEARMLPAVARRFAPPPGYTLATLAAARLGPRTVALKQVVVGDGGRLLWMLFGSLALVLVIVCANTANLLLLRAEGRQAELAIRTALGASRAGLAGTLLAESLWLGLCGGVLGLEVAAAGLRALVAAAPQGLARLPEVHLDGWTVLFTLGLGLAAGALLVLPPVARLGRLAARPEAARGASARRGRVRVRQALVVGQVALAGVLLAAVGLMARSARALARVPPGFALLQPIATFRLDVPAAEAPNERAVFQLQQRVVAAVAALPGVGAAGMANDLPMDGSFTQDPVFVEGRTAPASGLPPLRKFRYVSPGYLQALGIPLLAGRAMTWGDASALRPVAMVSASFARLYWPSPRQALGQRIRVTPRDEWRQIVGVVGDVHEDGLNHPPPAEVYWPLLAAHFEGAAINDWPTVSVVVRAPGAAQAAFATALRRAVWSVDRNLPVAGLTTLQHLYAGSLAQTRFTIEVLGLAAAMGLVVAVIGLYGALAYAVAQRRRELGVRLALGADPGALVRQILRQGLGLAAAGTAGGLLAAAFAARGLAALLYGVSPDDPTTLAATAAALLGVALLASLLPARAAARINPVEALRLE